jgi:ribosomal 30S subunit maturation factor RimM
MIRHLLEQYNEYQILRSWSNRSRLSRRQAMAQTPTAATRAEINSASLNHTYKGQWRLYKMIGLDVYNQNDEKVGDISELLVD